MPNGEPNVTDPERFRMWLVEELTEHRTLLKGLPCRDREAQIAALQAQMSESRGQMALVKRMLPWILAALAGGGFLGLGGKQALDGATGDGARPASHASP